MTRLVALIVLLVACGDDDGMSLDAGPDAPSPDAGIADPLPPEEHALPNLLQDGSCAPGWELVVDGDTTWCEPFPGGVEECLDHQAHVPGEAGCHSVGRTCAADFPEAPEGVSALYVRAGESGTGTIDAPFGTIAEAIAATGTGDAILVAAGTYEEDILALDRAVTIRGACAAQTRIVSTTPDEENGVFNVFGAGVVFEDLQIGGLMNGITVQPGGEATIRGVAFVDVSMGSIVVFGEAHVEDVVARMTNDRDAGSFNLGIAAYESAQLDVRRSVFRGHADVEAQIWDATATFEDVAFGARFRGLIPFGGRGLEAGQGANVIGRRVVFDFNSEMGAHSDGAGTRVELEDVLFGDVAGEIGGNVVTSLGGTAVVRRATMIAPVPSGVVMVSEGQVEAEDLLIVFAGADESVGYGIQAIDPGSLGTFTRTSIVASYSGGVVVDTGAHVSLIDTEVVASGTGGDYTEDQNAVGIAVLRGSLEVERVSVQSNDIFGIAADGTGSIRGTDLVITDTLTHPLTAGGGAFWAIDGITIDLERVSIDANQGTGIMLFDCEANFVDLTVQDTFVAACGDEMCTSFFGGIGLGVYDAAHATVERFRFSGNALMGAQVAYGHDLDLQPYPNGGELDLRAGTVADNLVGINVQVEDYDFDRLTQGVAFENNERNFDSTLMGVPTPPGL